MRIRFVGLGPPNIKILRGRLMRAIWFFSFFLSSVASFSVGQAAPNKVLLGVASSTIVPVEQSFGGGGDIVGQGISEPSVLLAQNDSSKTYSGYFGGREKLRDHLMEVLQNVCFPNIGSGEVIDAAAVEYSNGEPFFSETVIAGDVVKTKFYPIKLDNEDTAWVTNAGGRACGLATNRSLRMPQHIRRELDVTMEEKVSELFNYDDVELTYGSSEKIRLPIRQYSMVAGQNDRIDFIDFLAPDVSLADRKLTYKIFDRVSIKGDQLSIVQDGMMFEVIQSVCANDVGNPKQILEKAAQLTGKKVYTGADSEFTVYGIALTTYPLETMKAATSSFLSLTEDGDACGYWEIGSPAGLRDLFGNFDIVEIEDYEADKSWARLGYFPITNLAVIESFSEDDVGAMHRILYLSHDAYERIALQNKPVIPWKTN